MILHLIDGSHVECGDSVTRVSYTSSSCYTPNQCAISHYLQEEHNCDLFELLTKSQYARYFIKIGSTLVLVQSVVYITS